MLQGKRRAEWDQVASLILHIRLAAGDKKAEFVNFHPYLDQQELAEKASNDFKALGRKIKQRYHK